MNGVEVEVPEKPIAFNVCNCGQMMPVFVYGGADEENEAWRAHGDRHYDNGEPDNYSAASYEKALKYHFITEDMVFYPCTFFKP